MTGAGTPPSVIESQLRRLRALQDVDRIVVDTGSFTAQGSTKARAYRQLAHERSVLGMTDPIHQTHGLTANGAAALGSDFARCGLVFDAVHAEHHARFTDPFGVTWDWADGAPSAVSHPLEKATYRDITRLGAPKAAGRIVPGEASCARNRGLAPVCDAPLPGLLELCIRMRGQARFIEDLAGEPRTAGALLDWAEQVILDAYERVFAALPERPAIVFYEDDLGHQLGLFVAEDQFQSVLAPRMAAIVAALSKHAEAGVAFLGRGAISPLLRPLSDLGFTYLSVQTDAAGMSIADVRRRIPASMVLHGLTDFDALCRALRAGQADALLDIALTHALAWPVIAAPAAPYPSTTTVEDIAWASNYLKALGLGQKASRAEIVAERLPAATVPR